MTSLPPTSRGASLGRVTMRRHDGSPIRALVVDDEPVLAEMIGLALRYEGWQVVTAPNAATAVDAARMEGPDVVVLDLNLPDGDGLDVLASLRRQSPRLPVLLLSARDSPQDRIAGLSAGADDYVTKPFSIEEVVLRLRSLLRRADTIDSDRHRLVVGDLVLDEDTHEVSRAGWPIELTATEFELLRYFMLNAERVLSRAQILDRVWNYDFAVDTNIVEQYVSYLRRKIGNSRSPMIFTIRGAGYILKPAGEYRA